MGSPRAAALQSEAEQRTKMQLLPDNVSLPEETGWAKLIPASDILMKASFSKFQNLRLRRRLPRQRQNAQIGFRAVQLPQLHGQDADSVHGRHSFSASIPQRQPDRSVDIFF